MFRERAKLIDIGLRLGDVVALTASFTVAYLVRDVGLGSPVVGWPGLFPMSRYWPLLVLSLAAWIIASRLLKVYRGRRMPTRAAEAYRLAEALVVVAGVLFGFGFLAKQNELSRVFVCLYVVIGMGLLIANRVLLRNTVRALRRRGHSTRIVAIVGTGDRARAVAEAIRRRREWGYHLAGYIEEDDSGARRTVGPLIGSLSRLEQMLRTNVLDEVFFAAPGQHLDEVRAAVLLCKKKGVTARICVDFAGGSELSELSLEDLDGIPVLGVY